MLKYNRRASRNSALTPSHFCFLLSPFFGEGFVLTPYLIFIEMSAPAYIC